MPEAGARINPRASRERRWAAQDLAASMHLFQVREEEDHPAWSASASDTGDSDIESGFSDTQAPATWGPDPALGGDQDVNSSWKEHYNGFESESDAAWDDADADWMDGSIAGAESVFRPRAAHGPQGAAAPAATSLEYGDRDIASLVSPALGPLAPPLASPLAHESGGLPEDPLSWSWIGAPARPGGDASGGTGPRLERPASPSHAAPSAAPSDLAPAGWSASTDGVAPRGSSPAFMSGSGLWRAVGERRKAMQAPLRELKWSGASGELSRWQDVGDVLAWLDPEGQDFWELSSGLIGECGGGAEVVQCAHR